MYSGLRDMLGPDFDAKDMEDIFKGIVDNNDKNKVRKIPGLHIMQNTGVWGRQGYILCKILW